MHILRECHQIIEAWRTANRSPGSEESLTAEGVNLRDLFPGHSRGGLIDVVNKFHPRAGAVLLFSGWVLEPVVINLLASFVFPPRKLNS